MKMNSVNFNAAGFAPQPQVKPSSENEGLLIKDEELADAIKDPIINECKDAAAAIKKTYSVTDPINETIKKSPILTKLKEWCNVLKGVKYEPPVIIDGPKPNNGNIPDIANDL